MLFFRSSYYLSLGSAFAVLFFCEKALDSRKRGAMEARRALVCRVWFRCEASLFFLSIMVVFHFLSA